MEELSLLKATGENVVVVNGQVVLLNYPSAFLTLLYKRRIFSSKSFYFESCFKHSFFFLKYGFIS